MGFNSAFKGLTSQLAVFPWSRQQVSPKLWHILAKVHGVTFQNTTVCIVTAVRISNVKIKICPFRHPPKDIRASLTNKRTNKPFNKGYRLRRWRLFLCLGKSICLCRNTYFRFIEYIGSLSLCYLFCLLWNRQSFVCRYALHRKYMYIT